jgi:hypothetical protein
LRLRSQADSTRTRFRQLLGKGIAVGNAA